MYISANKNNTYNPDKPLAEVWELQIKSTPNNFLLKELTYRWTAVKSFTNSIFSFSLGINFYYFLYSLQIDTFP